MARLPEDCIPLDRNFRAHHISQKQFLEVMHHFRDEASQLSLGGVKTTIYQAGGSSLVEKQNKLEALVDAHNTAEDLYEKELALQKAYEKALQDENPFVEDAAEEASGLANRVQTAANAARYTADQLPPVLRGGQH